LRDERGIACEQKRFIKICNQLAEPKG
jgi:hypothetical protein